MQENSYEMGRLLGSLTAIIILIAAAVVLVQSRQYQDIPKSAQRVSLFLVVFSVGILVYLWAAPAPAPPPPPPISQEEAEARFRESQTALPTDTPAVIVQKMGCFVCHKIPTIPNANVGTTGPVLMLGTTAPQRLASPEYQARVKAGLAHATTPLEYVIESIIDPSAFVVPGYDKRDNPTAVPMYPHYKERFTPEALQFFAMFLLQLDEKMARDEGLLGDARPPRPVHP
ncbi:MAG TPA: hypothetical protein VLY45_05305 [Nitrospiria bacterium]|nr:hypothetical protein [Nitrospiria bacterium]